MARPTKFSNALAGKICNRLAGGESLRDIEKDDKMPSRVTVYRWLLDGKHQAFCNQYAQAREIQSEDIFEEIQDLSDKSVSDIVGDDKSDNARINARKLQIETRQWKLARMQPKKFGEKVDVTSGGKAIPLIAIPLNERDKENTGTK